MLVLISAFIISLLSCLLIIRYKNLHQHITGDCDFDGPQKFHLLEVPRIGGVAILAGLLIASCIRGLQNKEDGYFLLLLIACSLPAFLSGFFEDLTKHISIKIRLISTGISAALFGYVFEAWISSIGIPISDALFSIPLISIGFTIFAICGLANAYNIIDGFNGLSSMVSIITLLAISYVSFKVGDITLVIAALILIGANAGFFIWNYPKGFIFLGDGGAYLIGYWVGALSVLLAIRHPNISPWFPLLVNIYPIFETLFTMWRRRIHQGKNIGTPDGAHFHTLIYRRILRWAKAGHNNSTAANFDTMSNSKTSPYLWLLSTAGIIPAVLWWNNTNFLQACSLVFCLIYLWLYNAIVKFKTPKWLK